MGKRLTFVSAFVLGLCAAAPLTALLFVLERLLGVVSPPADLMNMLIRVLPGDLITFGLDRMVDLLLELNLARIDRAGKVAEELMATLIFASLWTLVGAGLLWLVRRRPLAEDAARALFLGTGLGLAGGLLAVSSQYNTSATQSFAVSVVLVLLALMTWAYGLSWLAQNYPSAPVADESEGASLQVLDRRRFLVQVGGGAALITVAGAGLGLMLPATEEIEGGDLDLPQLRTGLEPAPGTRPEYPPLADHYRIDINSGRPPAIDGATWRLKVRGLVAAEKEFTLDDLKNNFTAYDEFITIGCISNRVGGSLIGTTRWTGLRFQDFLAEVGVLPEAAFVHIYGADGFDEVVSLADIRADERILLAYEWDGVPLPQKHGFPLRVYLPDLYGMKQPKWITEMEFIPEWREGYWVRRNWSAIARVNATSVVDTVAVEAVYEQDGQRILPVGGIAWAGARGISSVEVRVDDGEWQAAQLRTPLSPLTWVIWRFDWPAQDGRHTFTVRCIEGDGTTRQIETPRGPRPDGATGLHRKTDTL